MNVASTTRAAHLDALRSAVSVSPPLQALDPTTYARDHAAFEARSDQRGLIADWLVARLSTCDSDPLDLLSVGCGDGALDAEVVQRLMAEDVNRSRLRYVGVEPFSGSAQRCTARMAGLDDHRLSAQIHVMRFADVRLDERFDAVTFVHSMYYVPDVLEAIGHAAQHLTPHGEVLVLSAPRGELNLLAGLLAPSLEGHHQWFSDDVRAALDSGELPFDEVGTIDAVVDLTDADDDVLDFTVQARLTPQLRDLVRRYLADVSLIPGRSVIAHPVDAYAVGARIGRGNDDSPE